jgi:hypothetical protein
MTWFEKETKRKKFRNETIRKKNKDQETKRNEKFEKRNETKRNETKKKRFSKPAKFVYIYLSKNRCPLARHHQNH